MKEIYFVRHGETDWNIQRRFQGITDIDLNDNGRFQGSKVGDFLSQINFDLIVTSPLSRAYETGLIISSKNKCKDIVKDELFIARSFGEFEGIEYTKAQGSDDFESFAVSKGADHMDDIKQKIETGINKYLNTDYQKILIASHTQILKAAAVLFDSENYPTYEDFYIGNCGVIKLTFDENNEFLNLETIY